LKENGLLFSFVVYRSIRSI